MWKTPITNVIISSWFVLIELLQDDDDEIRNSTSEYVSHVALNTNNRTDTHILGSMEV